MDRGLQHPHCVKKINFHPSNPPPQPLSKSQNTIMVLLLYHDGKNDKSLKCLMVEGCGGYWVEKMAILKLTNIKLSRKNNHVIITDKGTGVLGFLLSSNSVLGSLVF